jgi:hypothetical protein
LHPGKPHGVLRRDQSDDGFAVDAELMKYLEIGLDACAAARVRPGDRKRGPRRRRRSYFDSL